MDADIRNDLVTGFTTWVSETDNPPEQAQETLHIVLAIAATRIGKWVSEQEDGDDPLVKEEIERIGQIAKLSSHLGCKINPATL